MDDVVFPKSEADIGLIPVSAATFRRQHELAARQALLDRKIGFGLGLDAFGHAPEPPDEDLSVAAAPWSNAMYS